jgi:hypothetical protein
MTLTGHVAEQELVRGTQNDDAAAETPGTEKEVVRHDPIVSPRGEEKRDAPRTSTTTPPTL